MKHFSRGFTIVELLIVIVVIGILATISVFAFGNWRERVATNEVKSDLKGVQTAMESARNFSNQYPLTQPSTFSASNGVTLGYTSNGTTYCVDARSKSRTNIVYRVTDAIKEPQAGNC